MRQNKLHQKSQRVLLQTKTIRRLQHIGVLQILGHLKIHLIRSPQRVESHLKRKAVRQKTFFKRKKVSIITLQTEDVDLKLCANFFVTTSYMLTFFVDENENLGFGNMDSENDIQSFSQEKNVNFATFEKESGWDMNDDHSLGNKSFNGFFDSNPTFALEEPTSGLNITPTRRRLEFDPKLDHSPALEDSNFSEFNREGLSSVESPKDRRRSKTITDTIRALGKESPERKRGLKGLKNLFRKNEQRQ